MNEQRVTPFTTMYTDTNQSLVHGQQQLLQSVNSINANVIQTSNYFAHHIQAVEKRLQNAEKKKRRSCISENLAMQNNGKIVLVENYDDGTREVKEFAYNLTGRWSVARIELKKISINEEKYIILFPDSKLWICGNVRENKGKNLYEGFIKAGVAFAPNNSVSKIQKILFATFGAEIDRTQNIYYIPELSGWNEGHFLSAERCNYEKRRDFPDLPVMRKHFKVLRGNKQQLELYLKIYQNITRWQERLLLLEMPILGILSSIFVEDGRRLNRFLNLVFCDNIPTNDLLHLLQIFNRDELRSIDAGVNSNCLRSILEESNDEVVIVDATGEANGYIKKKRQDNVRQIAKKICHSGNSAFAILRELNLVLVVLNDTVVVQPDAINIMFSEEVFRLPECVKNMGGQIVDTFLAEFVLFAESRLEEIRSIIRNSYATTEGVFLSGWKILELFFDTFGIDIYNVGAFPLHIDFEKLLEKFEVPEDLAETFVTSIRKEISHWYMMEKHRMQKYVFSACYYDEKFLWIPTKILDRMLAQERLLPYKLNALYEMKKRGNLLTDSTGLSSRVQIGGKRIEAYKFRRTCFDMVGEADITDLGKEMTDYVNG